MRLVLVSLLVGCSAAPVPPAPKPPPPLQLGPVPPAATCAYPRLIVAPRVELACWPKYDCETSIPYAIENCTPAPVAVQTVFRNGHKNDGVQLEYDPVLTVAPGTTRTFEIPIKRTWMVAGKHTLVVRLTNLRILDASFELVDPAYEKARADCLAKGDDWGDHGGFSSNVGCMEVMKDAGKECNDERDCEGYCFLERTEKVSKTEKRVFGHCSRLKSRMGCHTAIGKTDHGIMPSNRLFPHLCVD